MRTAASAERGTRMRGRVREVGPPLRALPVGPGYVEHRTEDGRRIFLHRDVLTDLEMLERREHPDETAGLLFGRLFTDGRSPCALVSHLVWPEPGEVVGTPATVTITPEGSTGMARRANERHPCADPVGWAHTHPTFAAYFSATDRAEQAVWTEPASVGLVLSGLDDAEPLYAVFVGADSSLSEPVRSSVTRGRATRRSRPSRMSTARVRRSASTSPPSPSTPRSVSNGSPIEGHPVAAGSEPAPSRPRSRPRPMSVKREWIVVAVVSLLVLLAVLLAIAWWLTDGFRGDGAPARPQNVPAPIEIHHIPREVSR